MVMEVQPPPTNSHKLSPSNPIHNHQLHPTTQGHSKPKQNKYVVAAGSGQEGYPLHIITHTDHIELQHVIKQINLVAGALADSGLTTGLKYWKQTRFNLVGFSFNIKIMKVIHQYQPKFFLPFFLSLPPLFPYHI